MASSTQSGVSIFQPDTGQHSFIKFLGFLLVAGLINALIAAFVFCRLPASHAPSVAAIFVRALIYVFGTAIAGIAGARVYWTRSSSPFKSNPPLTFVLFAFTNAAGWVWIPSVVLLSSQDSPTSAAIAALGAAILAVGLRKALFLNTSALRQYSPVVLEETELFAESLHTSPYEAHGWVIAVCFYAACFALYDRSNLVACALLAPCAFLIAWKLTLSPDSRLESEQENTRVAPRLAVIVLPAILITFLALMLGVAGRNNDAAAARGVGNHVTSSKQKQRSAREIQTGIAGYESIILWPAPTKKEIVAPLPSRTSLFAGRRARSLVIRFNGAYWYFQAPAKRPGPLSHIARGNPSAVNIQSNNLTPLTMEAHQRLSSAIRVAHCREVQMAIENHDNRPGSIAVGLLLTDSGSPGQPSLYLAPQMVVSSESKHPSAQPLLINELLRFPIPNNATLRKFDEITVIFIPGVEHFHISPKITIQQFDILPR